MRILTGVFKGKAIPFRPSRDLRPTADKVRKAIIDLFAGWMEGKAVLDLYSGTGALGMELLSAGAASCVFVEKDPGRADEIRKWLDAARVSRDSRVLSEESMDSLRHFLRKQARFDLIVLDPPYKESVESAFPLMGELLNKGGFIVYECRFSQDASEFAGLEKVRDKLYGGTRLVVYRKTGGQTSPSNEAA